MTFSLHPRLATDTLPVGNLPLCHLRLMNDARFPWLVLIPRRDDLREFFDLTAAERAVLIEETTAAARHLQRATGAAKMNLGAIGNLVPQLHIHVVARFETDAAWPAPVWGHGSAEAYAAEAASALIANLSHALDLSH